MMHALADAEELEQREQWECAFRGKPGADGVDNARVLEVEVVALVDLREDAAAFRFARLLLRAELRKLDELTGLAERDAVTTLMRENGPGRKLGRDVIAADFAIGAKPNSCPGTSDWRGDETARMPMARLLRG